MFIHILITGRRTHGTAVQFSLFETGSVCVKELKENVLCMDMFEYIASLSFVLVFVRGRKSLWIVWMTTESCGIRSERVRLFACAVHVCRKDRHVQVGRTPHIIVLSGHFPQRTIVPLQPSHAPFGIPWHVHVPSYFISLFTFITLAEALVSILMIDFIIVKIDSPGLQDMPFECAMEKNALHVLRRMCFSYVRY